MGNRAIEGSVVQVETTVEAAVLGWVATRSESGTGERHGQPLIEILAEDLGLDPDPATLDELAATLLALERDERIVLDGPVETAADLAPLDLAGGGAAPTTSQSRPLPSIEAYSKLAAAPQHVQLNWALRALRARTDPQTATGEFDFRSTITDLELNPKDVRHDLEMLGYIRKPSGASTLGTETWWVDPDATVTAADLETARQAMTAPPTPPATAAPVDSGTPGHAGNRGLLADLGPVMESLSKLEPRLVDLIHQLVEAAESMQTMAGTQAQLLREQVSEIESLRQDRERLVRDAAALRQEMWNLKHRNARSPEAEELSAEASRLRAAERRFAGTASEVTDKVRRVNRGLDDAAAED